MSKLQWRLVEQLSGALEPDERDAVYGDLLESGSSGGIGGQSILFGSNMRDSGCTSITMFSTPQSDCCFSAINWYASRSAWWR